MEIFNATNLLYIWGGFVKTIEISALSIFFSLIFGTVLALVKSYAPRPFRILVSCSGARQTCCGSCLSTLRCRVWTL